MLTQDQKNRLTELMVDCEIPILKDILREALPRFISGEVKPIQDNLGVFIADGKWKLRSNKSCCLIGASLIDRLGDEGITYYSDIEYSIREEITSAFDDIPIDRNTEISEYVSKIRKVIFGC